MSEEYIYDWNRDFNNDPNSQPCNVWMKNTTGEPDCFTVDCDGQWIHCVSLAISGPRGVVVYYERLDGHFVVDPVNGRAKMSVVHGNVTVKRNIPISVENENV